MDEKLIRKKNFPDNNSVLSMKFKWVPFLSKFFIFQRKVNRSHKIFLADNKQKTFGAWFAENFFRLFKKKNTYNQINQENDITELRTLIGILAFYVI